LSTPVDDDGVAALDRQPTVRFGPDRRLAALVLVLGVGFLALAVTTADAGGRLLYLLAGVLSLAIGVADLVVTPRLTVDGSGLRVRAATSLRWKKLTWAEMHGLVVDTRERHGLTSTTLEIDDGTALIMLGRHALGGDPRLAAEVIEAFRAGAS
jgi:hypothetical protein